MFWPTIGLGIAVGSNPGPGSRTTISMPRVSSQATSLYDLLRVTLGTMHHRVGKRLGQGQFNRVFFSGSTLGLAHHIHDSLDHGVDGVLVSRQRDLQLQHELVRIEVAITVGWFAGHICSLTLKVGCGPNACDTSCDSIDRTKASQSLDSLVLRRIPARGPRKARELPTPVQFIDELPRIPPARLNLYIEFQENLAA